MPQKIDVHGLFLAPESITDLMLQKRTGRNVKQTSIREIPAKVRLLSGQWVDVLRVARVMISREAAHML